MKKVSAAFILAAMLMLGGGTAASAGEKPASSVAVMPDVALKRIATLPEVAHAGFGPKDTSFKAAGNWPD